MNKMTFKVIAIYQYAENYGAHDWNGEGECPQYWKMKGGHEELLFDGLDLNMALDPEFSEWASELGAARSYYDEYSSADFQGLSIVPSDTLDTMDEMDAEYHGDYEYLALFSNDASIVPDDANAPIDRYDAISEQLGFLWV